MKKNLYKQTYNTINLMKFICSILVVSIHTNPLIGLSVNLNHFIVNILGRIAVPFFFICSGYFLTDKLFEEDKVIRRYNIKRYILGMSKIYVTWSFIYMVFDFNVYFKGGNIFKELLILIRNFIFIGTHFHLWYMVSLIASVYFIYKFLSIFNFKNLILISGLLYIFIVAGSSYYGFFSGTMLGTTVDIYIAIFGQINSFIMGVPFIVMGICIKRYSCINKFKNIKYIFSMSLIIYIIESFTLKYLNVTSSNYTTLFLPIVSCSIFILLINLENKISKCSFIIKYSNIFKEWSLNIYLSHGIFLIIFSNICNIFEIKKYHWIPIVNFIVVVSLSIMLAELNRKIAIKPISIIKESNS